MIFRNRLAKFLVTGGSAATVEYGSFILLTILLSPPVVVSNSASFFFGFVVSFMLNRTWVFKSKEGARRQLGQYMLLALINLALGNLAIGLLVSFAVPLLVAKIVTMLLVASWNYLIFSKFIFKSNSI